MLGNYLVKDVVKIIEDYAAKSKYFFSIVDTQMISYKNNTYCLRSSDKHNYLLDNKGNILLMKNRDFIYVDSFDKYDNLYFTDNKSLYGYNVKNGRITEIPLPLKGFGRANYNGNIWVVNRDSRTSTVYKSINDQTIILQIPYLGVNTALFLDNYLISSPSMSVINIHNLNTRGMSSINVNIYWFNLSDYGDLFSLDDAFSSKIFNTKGQCIFECKGCFSDSMIVRMDDVFIYVHCMDMDCVYRINKERETIEVFEILNTQRRVNALVFV